MLAYIHSDHGAHYVCSQCPDSENVKKACEALETKTEILAMQRGITDYVKRMVVMTICEPCITQKENEARVGLNVGIHHPES